MRYGVQRVCRIFGIARSTVDSFMAVRRSHPDGAPRVQERGPVGFATDEELVAHTRRVLVDSPFHGRQSKGAWPATWPARR